MLANQLVKGIKISQPYEPNNFSYSSYLNVLLSLQLVNFFFNYMRPVMYVCRH